VKIIRRNNTIPVADVHFNTEWADQPQRVLMLVTVKYYITCSICKRV